MTRPLSRSEVSEVMTADEWTATTSLGSMVTLKAVDIAGTDSGLVLSWEDFDEETQAFVVRMTRPLYDAIPRIRVDITGLPTADELEDDESGEWIDPVEPRCLVYFGLAALSGLIRIGMTTGSAQRQSGYRSASGEDIRFFNMPGSRRLEARILDRFRPLRHHGSWFWPHPVLLAYMFDAVWL